MPAISVIVPVYNTEQYLHRCIDSILAQTFSDFELLLVDDGSTDASGAICDDYAAKDPRIRVFHQTNRGQAAARNHALDWMFSNSDSEYISFVDSDDWVHPRYLELLYAANQRFGTNISQCLHIETDGTIEIPEVDEKTFTVSSEEEYISWYSAFIWEKLYRKSVWEHIRFPVGQIYEDVAIWYKILFAEETISLVQEILYYYFVNPYSTVRSNWTPAKLEQVHAWQEQLAYADEYLDIKVLDAVLYKFFWVLDYQYKDISRSTLITGREKTKFRWKIKSIARLVMNQYKKDLKRNGSYTLYYAWTHPISHWAYWTWNGIRKKLKRIR